MADFLVVAGISNDTIKKLKEISGLMFSLESNKDEVIGICNYLRRIGIKDIDSIILYRPYMFLETVSSINYFFNKFNLEEMVSKINEDTENIDLLFE